VTIIPDEDCNRVCRAERSDMGLVVAVLMIGLRLGASECLRRRRWGNVVGVPRNRGRTGVAWLIVLLVPALLMALLLLPNRAHAAAGPVSAPKQPLATGTGGAVASMDSGASQAGIDALRHGGNAVDAAVATASAMGVTIPFVAGPGGGGFMIIYDAKTHKVTTIDGRETCPAACTSKLFVNLKTGKPMGYENASSQPLSTGVPSMVATWAEAVKLYGARRFGADLQPAIGIARRGFRVDRDFVQLERSGLKLLRAYPASRSLFLTKAGKPLPVGSVMHNPGLARTYSLLAQHGPSYLYDGPLGQAVVNAVDHPVLTSSQKVVTRPGIMTTRDLASYVARVKPPTRADYRGIQIDSTPPPSSGGSTVAEALNILSGWNLGTEPRATALFHYLEASRLAYADRDRYVGDPRYVHVPLRRLLSTTFAASRRCLVGQRALKSPVAPGTLSARGCGNGSAATVVNSASPERHHTNNIVAVDRQGDIAVYTNTINFFGGSGETVPGYGFLLNDELTDFDFAPAVKGTPDPNLPAGGKQPRSSIGPTIALRDGRPVFALGAAGGSTIPTTILETIVNHLDFGMSLPAALAAPRVSQTDSSTSLAEPAFYNSPLRHQLTARFGEKFSLATGSVLPLDHYPGDATALSFLGGGRVQAIAEPLRLFGGSALVVHPSK
jgi:gamma-glutamyltranspeptidase/glutathione hydrolase